MMDRTQICAFGRIKTQNQNTAMETESESQIRSVPKPKYRSITRLFESAVLWSANLNAALKFQSAMVSAALHEAWERERERRSEKMVSAV